MMLFYFTGRFYDPAYRLAGLRYSYTREMNTERPPYVVLGVLVAIQLVVQVASAMKDGVSGALASPKDEAIVVEYEEEEEEASSGQMCVLCMEERKDDTATTCGHIFCWQCIWDWTLEKPECPLCRTPVKTNKLIRLRHYAA